MKYRVLGKLAEFESTFPKLLCPVKKKEFILDFVYPAVGEGGSFFPLFKTLLTNKCLKNCFYCANRQKRNVERFEFKPAELANLFIEYYKKKWACGIFLSSSIYPDANKAQEKILETIKILREKYGYSGYIHTKIMPGADKNLIDECAKYSDRLSVNLEAPSEKFIEKLSPDKRYPSELVSTLDAISKHSKKLKYGITTQFVVGAAGESDKDILFYVEFLYRKYNLRRTYYSGFVPVEDTPLDRVPPCSRLREYRLYQADFLMRRYNFKAKEFVYDRNDNLVLEHDPKFNWALRNAHLFPVEINMADYNTLIRVPGIGLKSAKKIIDLRKNSVKFVDVNDLKKIGVVLRKAVKFITLNGRLPRVNDFKATPAENKQLFIWEEL